MTERTQDLHIASFEPLVPPSEVFKRYPATAKATAAVTTGREELRRALAGKDRRFVVVVGPCSIHDPDAAYDYAQRLAQLRGRFADRLLIVMRVYFEKPRTTAGWTGLINDPHMDGSYDFVHGLQLARQILLKINELGLPCATEFLDPIVPQYTSDLVAWAAIGARTTESPTHRQMASGLSMPVGFKNATNGSLQVALDAMTSARSGHEFVGIDAHGLTSIIKTTGNPDVHLVLRGGSGQASYSKADIAYTKALLDGSPTRRDILIDCSHGHGNRNFLNQPRVFSEILSYFAHGETAILGAMIESNLVAGRQDPGRRKPLTYGQSVTDGCIGWDMTIEVLENAYRSMSRLGTVT